MSLESLGAQETFMRSSSSEGTLYQIYPRCRIHVPMMNFMDGRAMLRVDIGSYVGILV